MAVEKSVFGKGLNGEEIMLYTLKNSKGMQACVTNLGAILVRLIVPDGQGNGADVVLGFDRAEDYFGNPSFFGAVIGPSANRIGGAAFSLDGADYALDVNDGPNNLHSHKEKGYHKKLWSAQVSQNSVTFSLEDSRQLCASLRRQQEVEFHEGEFDVNASGLMSALEPFEMQPMAQVHAVFGASAK